MISLPMWPAAFRSRASGTLMPWLFSTPDGIIRHVPRPRVTVDDGTAGWAMIRDGLGISWAPSWLGIDDLRTGRVVEVLPAVRVPPTALSVVRLDRRLTPKRITVVIDHLERQAPRWSGSA